MYIITNKDNVVMGVTEKVIHAPNGDIGINETYFFSAMIVGEVLEVDALPAEYEDDKYKYIDGKFVIREDWQPAKTPMTVEELHQLLEVQEQAITELSIYVATLGI